MEIVSRGAAAMAAAQGGQRQEEAGARAGWAATQPGTMPPPPVPARTGAAPATPAGSRPTIGPGGAERGPVTVTRPKPRRPQGLGPRSRPVEPAPVAEPVARREFNAQMSNEDILKALSQLLPDQFAEPPEVTAEFAEEHLAPPADAPQTIAQRYLQRIQTNENLDEGSHLDRGQAIGILRGLWRRYCKEEHERRPPHKRPRLATLPLPVKEWEEQLDAQGVDSMGLDEEGIRAYMAQLETAIRTWWQTVGPADILPPQFGRLVNPEGPPTGPRWPTHSFLTLQVQLWWALERAERTFGGGVDVSDPIRTWLTGIEFKQFGGLHNRPERAPDDEGKFSRNVSMYPPVDANPKPPEQGTYSSRQDDMAIVPDLEHLQPEEMREMEMVLRSLWQTEARAPFEDDRFRGPPSEATRTQGFQAEELAGRISRWERTGKALGKDRTQVERAIRMRGDLWKAAFDDYGLQPPKPRTELVSRRGDTFYTVKWTPELTRPAPAPTEQPETMRPSDDVESGPQLIWTREPSPGVGPFRRPQPATNKGGNEGTAPGAEGAPSVSRAQRATAPDAPPTAPATAGGQVTVSQVLNESLAQATQQLAAALPN
jgi:hypothetical protein